MSCRVKLPLAASGFFSSFLFFFFLRLVVRTDWSLGRQGRNAYAFNGTGVFGGASGGCAVVGNGGNNTRTRPNLPAVRSAGHTCSSPQLICRQISRFGGSRPPGPPDKCSVVTSCLRVRRGHATQQNKKNWARVNGYFILVAIAVMLAFSY